MMESRSGLNRPGSKIILWLLILCMLGFTMSRTLHFLKQTFPPDQAYVAYVALAAFDLGVLGWLYFAMHAAEGEHQRTVAYGMIFVCSFGVIATTVCDILIVSAQNGVASKPDPAIGTVALWVVCGVIALNFFAGILVHMLDPKHMKHMASERAKDIIHRASLEAIHERAGTIAPHVASVVAQHWENQITQELIGFIPGTKVIESLPDKKEPLLLTQEVDSESQKKKRVKQLPITEKLGKQAANIQPQESQNSGTSMYKRALGQLNGPDKTLVR